MRATQNKQVLEYLKENTGITPIHALKHLNIMRLSARIYDLRNEGHNITTTNVRHAGKTFAYYRLQESS